MALKPTVTIGGAPAGYKPATSLEPTVTIGGAPAGYKPAITLQPTVTIGGAPADYETTLTPNYITGVGVPGSTAYTTPTTPNYITGEGVGGSGFTDTAVSETVVPKKEPTSTPAEPKKDAAYDALVAAMGVYKIGNLAATLDKIRMDYPDITSADMLTLLRNDSRYNGEYLNRFSGNKILAANGKPMIDEKTYLQNEQAYAATFKAYGLNQYFSSPDMYAKLIGGEVAPTEMANRVSAVYDRVLNADPSTLDVYKRYYKGLGTQDIVAAILDPKDTMPAIERKITSAEIGGAAVRQGLNAFQAATDIQSQRYSNVMAGTVGSDALAAAGETSAQATADYAKIAYELPTFEKLSAISGSTLEQYGQKQAEQNTILQLASAKRAKDAQIAAEQARFGGSSGTSKGAFSTGYLSKESGAGQF
jgi:hypothetical protein